MKKRVVTRTIENITFQKVSWEKGLLAARIVFKPVTVHNNETVTLKLKARSVGLIITQEWSNNLGENKNVNEIGLYATKG